MRISSFVPSSSRWLGSGLAALLLLGCPSEDPVPLDDSTTGMEPMATTFGTACTPGQQIACACPGGLEGVQTCMSDGSGFDGCTCDPGPLDDSTGPDATGTTDGGTTVAETGSTGGTTGSTGGTTGTTGSESTDTGTTGDALVCDMYMSPPGVECDVWLQDCPAGNKCMPWANDGGSSWNAWRCSPLDAAPDQLGDPCTVDGSGTSGIDSCDIGLMCWDVDAETNIGVCSELCNGCPDDASCTNAGDSCVITNGDFLTLCLPGCDPLLQNCPAGDGCYPLGDQWLCAPDASGAMGVYGDPCEFINVCDPGLVCLSAGAVPPGEACMGASGCCTEICDVTDPAGDAQCNGAAGGQMCTAWYPAGMAPLGYEDVGVCAL